MSEKMTVAAARALVKRRGLVPFTDVEGAGPSFVRAVTGEAVRGSWWGHPKGKEIFSLANALAPDVVWVKLLGGKETLVHKRLWPALVRIAGDPAWRKKRMVGLEPAAKRLLEAVEDEGELRLDEHAPDASKAAKKVLTRARLELERRLLVRAFEVHTDSGKHATVLEPWSRWASKEVRASAAELTLDGARESLISLCGKAPPEVLK